jgi:LPPG:FO 2-phospho-L-lactate transferase
MAKFVALAGGIGGAKLATGLSKLLKPDELKIIVNTSDDFTQYGVNISPDLDSVCYSIAGVSDPINGWGRENDTHNCFSELKSIGETPWFVQGDKDLAYSLERTRLTDAGLNLSQVTKILCSRIGIAHEIIPMSDERVSTKIVTKELGVIPFQEYFVRYKCQPTLSEVIYNGLDSAGIADAAINAINGADFIIICPSNPWLSIFPILGLHGMKELLAQKTVIAVSPIIGSIAVKGPAAKIFIEKGIKPCASAVAFLYKDILKGFVLDLQNITETELIRSWGIIPFATDTLMQNIDGKKRLAAEVIDFATQF